MSVASDSCVVHLVWAPLGPAMLERFLAAYCSRPAGRAHSLVIAFNGLRDEAERAPYEALLTDVPHETFVMPGSTQDIPVYLAVARRVEHEYLCFLNSYSTPLADGWLAMLHAHVSREDVGVVGASGSWESRFSATAPAPERVPRTLHPKRWAGWMIRSYQRLAPVELRRTFAPFPNPHLRSNGFMIRRRRLLGLSVGPIASKLDAERFESGRRGMTRQLQARQLRALVVGRDGAAYPPDRWPTSRTFRSGEQENLLIADNRTQQYAEASVEERARLRRLAWGAGEAT